MLDTHNMLDIKYDRYKNIYIYTFKYKQLHIYIYIYISTI